jgi:hypothetical protein
MEKIGQCDLCANCVADNKKRIYCLEYKETVKDTQSSNFDDYSYSPAIKKYGLGEWPCEKFFNKEVI